MSWAGDMHGSKMRETKMSKEKTGGWQTCRRRVKNGWGILRTGGMLIIREMVNSK
jgi:hypothetical protein